MILLNKQVTVGLDGYSQQVTGALLEINSGYIVMQLVGGPYVYPMHRVSGIEQYNG